jgi:TetR/AcrR family transcriptional regulator, transcriptional repressor for nem operon
MSDTRTRLVDAALELFWFRGYSVTSLAEVCEKAEANPGSLYHFFRSKEELLEAALDRLLSVIGPNLLQPAWQGVDDPIERIFALLDAYRRSLEHTSLTYGCPVGSLALEWRDPPEGVRMRLAANFDAWTGAVRECLEDGRGRFPPSTDLDRLATFVLTTMEGAVMLARTHRDLRPFDQSVAALREHVTLLMRPG